MELISHHKVDAIVTGEVTLEDLAALLSELVKTTKIPNIISLSPSPQQIPPITQLPSFFQISNPSSYQIHCTAAIVAHFRWRKVILIHEQFSHNSSLSNRLSNALDRHFSFPRISSLSNPAAFIEQKLKKIRNRNVKVIILAQSSLEFSLILFHKAKSLGMMDNGYAWIVSDEISNFLDSVDLSVILNMQGVIGLKTDYQNSREFKTDEFDLLARW